MKKRHRIFFVLILTFLPALVQCQIELEEQRNSYRVSLFYGNSLQTFFDGYSRIQLNRTRTFLNEGWSKPSGFNPARQIEVGVFLKNAQSINFGINSVAAYYPEKCYQCGDKGDVLDREWTIFDVYYDRKLLVRKGLDFGVLCGLTHRRGTENEISYYGWFDVLILWQDMKDYGVIFGISVNQNLFKDRAVVRFTLKHNEYLYRYSTGKGSPYSWDNGSSRRMMSAAVNLGFRFGKVKNKKY